MQSSVETKAREMAKSKRQMTQAKRAREQALLDRRQRKREKKLARAQAAASQPTDQGVAGEPGSAAP